MIVGIGHKARRGKDTAASALVRDEGFVRIGFADALKELAVLVDPIVGETGPTNVGAGRGRLSYVVRQNGWDQAKDRYPEVRRFLQELGTGVRQVLGEALWVEHVIRQVGDRDVVIPDVRFPNEAQAIKDAGGIVVRIDRAVPPRIAASASSTHDSETALDGWEFDYTIDNGGSIVDLENAIKEIVAEAKKAAAGKATVKKGAGDAEA